MRAATQGQLVIAENLLPSLDILGIRGWAKINNVVSVITTNGGTATYHTGGEVNVKIATSFGQSTLAKIPFGVQLTVQPRLDPSSGLIVVSIDAEQSQLTPIQGQDVPGRVLTKTKTNVHVKIGQSIMLSGFKESTESLNAHGHSAAHAHSDPRLSVPLGGGRLDRHRERPVHHADGDRAYVAGERAPHRGRAQALRGLRRMVVY